MGEHDDDTGVGLDLAVSNPVSVDGHGDVASAPCSTPAGITSAASVAVASDPARGFSADELIVRDINRDRKSPPNRRNVDPSAVLLPVAIKEGTMSEEEKRDIREANRILSREQKEKDASGKVIAGRREEFALNPTDEPETDGEHALKRAAKKRDEKSKE